MIIVFIIMLAISVAILIISRNDRTTAWCAAVPFLFSFGCIGGFIYNSYLMSGNYSRAYYLWVLTALFFSVSQQIAPYAFFVYSLLQSDIIKKRKNIFLAEIIAAVPPISMYFIFPIIPQYKPSFLILSLWVTPYVIGGNLLLLYAFFKEKNKSVKMQNLLNFIILAPPTLFWLYASNLVRIFHNDILWQYNTITIAVSVTIFAFASVKSGVMGIRLKFENNILDDTIKGISKGTLIMNHAIKNEIIKIDLCVDELRELYKNLECEKAKEDLEYITQSTRFLKDYMTHIKNYVGEIDLNEESVNLYDVIHKAIDLVRPNIDVKQISVINKCSKNVYLTCDKIHIVGVIVNLLKNSVEALENGGKIIIEANSIKKYFAVLIRDNGKGISKENLLHVAEPFFTTKKHSDNFGLGLSYAVHVMERHKGELDINSTVGQGTTIALKFPKWKAKFADDVNKSGEI